MPHLNRLDETVQKRGHNIWFQREIRKIVIKYPPYLELCLKYWSLKKQEFPGSVVDNSWTTNPGVARWIPCFSGLLGETLNRGPVLV